MQLTQPNPPPLKASPLKFAAGVSRLHLFGVPFDLLGRSQLFQLFSNWLSEDRPRFVITANALFLLDVERSEELQSLCHRASLVIPDSSGITWAARRVAAKRQGSPLPEKLAGIDVAYQLCLLAEMKSVPVYLLGGAPGVASQAANFLCREFQYLHVAGMRDGFFRESDEARILNDIATSRAKVVLVAMGMPRQELWIYLNLHRLPPAIYIGVGGTLDVWAGNLKRAPEWMQNFGIEWLYRLIQQPWRITRMWHLPRFALKVMFMHA